VTNKELARIIRASGVADSVGINKARNVVALVGGGRPAGLKGGARC
jgi:hypothetical protein